MSRPMTIPGLGFNEQHRHGKLQEGRWEITAQES